MLCSASQARLARATRPQGCRARAAVAPVRARRSLAVRAQQDGSSEQPEATGAAAPAAAPAEQQQQQPAAAPAPNAPVLAKGQGTAIVTGAISVIFGVAYLALVYVMDMRGGEMQPPPPEAFLP